MTFLRLNALNTLRKRKVLNPNGFKDGPLHHSGVESVPSINIAIQPPLFPITSIFSFVTYMVNMIECVVDTYRHIQMKAIEFLCARGNRHRFLQFWQYTCEQSLIPDPEYLDVVITLSMGSNKKKPMTKKEREERRRKHKEKRLNK